VRDRLYAQAVALADQARLWFDGPGRGWRGTLNGAEQAAVATESLAITARLMALIAWALHPDNEVAAGHPFPMDTQPPLPPNHPLQGTPGGRITEASRALVNDFRTALD